MKYTSIVGIVMIFFFHLFFDRFFSSIDIDNDSFTIASSFVALLFLTIYFIQKSNERIKSKSDSFIDSKFYRPSYWILDLVFRDYHFLVFLIFLASLFARLGSENDIILSFLFTGLLVTNFFIMYFAFVIVQAYRGAKNVHSQIFSVAVIINAILIILKSSFWQSRQLYDSIPLTGIFHVVDMPLTAISLVIVATIEFMFIYYLNKRTLR